MDHILLAIFWHLVSFLAGFLTATFLWIWFINKQKLLGDQDQSDEYK